MQSSIVPSTNSKVYSGFDPRSLPGCVLWLDAADVNTMTLSGSAVSQWRDKSINAKHVNQATGSLQPTYTNNSISFSSTYLTNPVSLGLGSTASAYLVYRPTTSSANSRAFRCASNATTWILYDNSQVAGQCGSFGGYTTYGSVHVNQTYIVGYTATGTVIPQYGVNGATFVNMAIPYPENQGSFFIDVGRNYQGFIYEILVYDNVLSSTSRQQLEGYLAKKWSVNANIPIIHPYKTVPLYTQLFKPVDIPGCILWLDAADASVFSGGATWFDKSGTGNNTTNGTPGTTSMPAITTWTNGLQAARFVIANKSSMKTTNTIPSTFMTYVFVARVPTAPASRGFFFINNIDGSKQCFTTSTSFPMTITSFVSVNDAVTFTTAQNTPFIFIGTAGAAGVIGTTNYNVYKDGSFVSAKSVASATASIHYFGSANEASNYLTVDFAEILIYNVELTSSQRRQLEGYLGNKWGIASNLPSTHVFKLYYPLQVAFNPLAIPSCAVWLDAADSSTITLSGSNITQWRDKSGNGKHATQATPSQGPTYTTDSGYPAALFTRANAQYLQNATSVLTSTSYSIFYAFRTLSPATTQYVYFHYKKAAGGTGQNFIQHVFTGVSSITSSSIVYGDSPSTQKVSSNVTGSTSKAIYEMIDSPTNTTSNFFYNASPLTTTFTNGGTANIATDVYGYTLGALRTTTVSTTNSFNGYFYEVLIYLAELTTLQRRQVEGYLAWKWGMQTSLPTTHPYYKFRP